MELRTVRDSVIVLSVRPLAGIEVARIRLDGNGFLIVNRFDRVYAEGVYNELDILQGMEVPAFARIQTLLTERVFVEEEQLFFRELVGIRFSQVQTDIPVATDVVIPLKYRRITIQELFESIKKKI
jgi:hypothetical protein